MFVALFHLYTAFLPALFILIALAFFIASIRKKDRTSRKTAMVFFIINGIITTATSAFGGASIRRFRDVAYVNDSSITFHAWTALIAFVLSVIILILAIRESKGDSSKRNNSLFFVLSFLFVVMYIWTICIAFNMGAS